MADVADLCVVQSRNNLSKWEDDVQPLASLCSFELDSVIELSWTTLWRPCDAESANADEQFEEVSEDVEIEKSVPTTDLDKNKNIFVDIESRLESSQQFLKWYAVVESRMAKEWDEPYQKYISQLENHRNECRTLLSQLNEAMKYLHKLNDQYTSVSLKTSALHTDCEHLLEEQTRLLNKADTMEFRLNYFTEINKISQKLSSPTFKVSNEAFITLLTKINECINYLNSNSSYKESSLYLAKYKQCLNRSLSMVKTHFTKSMENALSQVLPRKESERINADDALILYYGKFRTFAPRMKILMTEIENRVRVSSEYENLLSDCHDCYFSQRKILLHPCVSDAVTQLIQNYVHDYCSLVRSGTAFLVHVCDDECNLYYQFFTLPTPELDTFLQSLCLILYDYLRPLIIHIDHLETLSELCNILRRSAEEHIQSNKQPLSALPFVVNQLLEDCQERLVYRAQIYIQNDILKFCPSPGDLAYPSKLEMMESIAESLAAQKKANLQKNASVSSMSSIRSSMSDVFNAASYGEEGLSHVGNSPADLYGMWYPSVRRTLMCLSKVYRSVDKAIFQGVCVEALTACMESLSEASARIAETSTVLDSQLFQIKHLLILREQLAPFQVENNLRETSLDWSKLKNAAYGLVEKRSRLFSLNSNNALLEFIVEGTPQVTESILDSKRNVDTELKKVCERLICSTTESLLSSLTAFMAKVEVIFTMNKEENVKPIVLKSQTFASPQNIADLICGTQKVLKTRIPSIQKSFRLYLANKDTEFILFKPIRTKVMSEFKKLSVVVGEHYGEEEKTIIACPSQEELSLLLSSLFT